MRADDVTQGQLEVHLAMALRYQIPQVSGGPRLDVATIYAFTQQVARHPDLRKAWLDLLNAIRGREGLLPLVFINPEELVEDEASLTDPHRLGEAVGFDYDFDCDHCQEGLLVHKEVLNCAYECDDCGAVCCESCLITHHGDKTCQAKG